MLKIKTVRLRDLIKSSGRPAAHLLWKPPEQDAEFTRALEDNRVLSVHQLTGVSHRDFGIIGFLRDPGISCYIFPKPFAYAEGTKVIGIDYEILGGGHGEARLPKHKAPHHKKTVIASGKRLKKKTPAIGPI